MIPNALRKESRVIDIITLLNRAPLCRQTDRHPSGVVTVDLLYRNTETRIQIERIHVTQGTIVPEHSHPNVDTYEYGVSGGGSYSIGHHRYTIWKQRSKPIPISRGIFHGGHAELESIFISLQLWAESVTMTTIMNDWLAK